MDAQIHWCEARQPLAATRKLAESPPAEGAVRLVFIRQVFGLFSVQLIATAAVASWVVNGGQDVNWLRSHEWLFWLSVMMVFGTVCTVSCCEGAARSYPTNYYFLFVFTFFEAIMVGFISAVFTPQSLLLSTAVTGVVFVGLTMLALTRKVDFAGWGIYGIVGALALASLGAAFGTLQAFGIPVETGLVLYDLLGIVFFSFFIVFDTQRMLVDEGDRRLGLEAGDYVFAALSLYLDIVNIFLHVLSLAGRRKN